MKIPPVPFTGARAGTKPGLLTPVTVAPGNERRSVSAALKPTNIVGTVDELETSPVVVPLAICVAGFREVTGVPGLSCGPACTDWAANATSSPEAPSRVTPNLVIATSSFDA